MPKTAKKFKEALAKVDRTRNYALKEAIELVKKAT